MVENNSKSFKDYYDKLLVDQERDLRDLISATEDDDNNNNNDDEDRRSELRALTRQVMGSYEEYYRVKSEWAHRNVLSLLSPPWKTSLEAAFTWIGGWRASMSFHVIYSKSGLQLESWIQNMIQASSLGSDLADLSSEQFKMMDELQRLTIREENEISEKMAKVQESSADASMVELSHAMSQMQVLTAADQGRAIEDRVERALSAKERKLAEMLRMADDLRLRTCRAIVDEVLTPIQAVHFLIAMAELHLRLHEWGKKRDGQD